MKKSNYLFHTIFLVSTFSQPSLAAFFSSVEIVEEATQFALSERFDSVGFMQSIQEDGTYLLGSGILIDEYWVATNGHVVLNGGTNQFPNIGFSLEPDFLQATNDDAISADEVFVYPGYNDNLAAGTGVDLALVKLSEPISSVTPAKRFRGEDVLDRKIYTAGYGRPGVWDIRPTVLDFDGKKRAGESRIHRFAFGRRSPIFAEAAFEDLPNFRFPFEWQGSPGDSGGAWFSDIDGESLLVNINSYNISPGFTTGGLRVSLFNDWIDATIAANSVPEPAAISMLLAGLIGSQTIRRSVA